MRTMHVVITALCLVAAASLHAQESNVRIGFGVSAGQIIIADLPDDNIMTPLHLSTVSIPIYLTKSFRVEPEFGIISRSQEVTWSTPRETQTSTTTNFRLGIGIHYVIQNLADVEQMSLYLGPHLEVLPFSYERTSSLPGTPARTESQSNLMLGFRVGGEYSPVRPFSIGIETGLEYISVGDTESSFGSSSEADVSDYWLNLSTAIRLRVYFN
jgi:hypothetical protein